MIVTDDNGTQVEVAKHGDWVLIHITLSDQNQSFAYLSRSDAKALFTQGLADMEAEPHSEVKGD